MLYKCLKKMLFPRFCLTKLEKMQNYIKSRNVIMIKPACCKSFAKAM